MSKKRNILLWNVGDVFDYKGDTYAIMGVATSLNGGEYYICFRHNSEDNVAWLIPMDSEEIRFHD